jgi:hypothetical protein
MTAFGKLLRELSKRPGAERTLEVLRELCELDAAPNELVALHEALLFCAAYPLSREIHNFCLVALRGLSARVSALKSTSRSALDQTGVAGSKIFYPYDLAMVRFLLSIGATLDVDWDAYEERDSDPLSPILPLLAERAENDALDDPELTAREFIEAARSPRQTALAWIVDGFSRAFRDERVRDQIYNGMELSLVMTLDGQAPSRTLGYDHVSRPVVLWEPAAARAPFELLAEVQRPLAIGKPVNEKRGRELLHLAYGALLPRLRELYPAIHGNPAEVYDIPLERGVRIVLWFMRAEYRLPLEAGWGLLLLKNNIPIGYGAGAMLDDRSEIAINVFDTFRGGEAAWLYAQYARVFHALGHADWLVTRRYQIGYENEEGLASGSYWFYDKLGFRSVDAGIRRLADTERRKIAKDRSYRSPRRILKLLCQADVVLSLSGARAASYREFPLAKVGLLASRTIANEFGGKRRGLEKQVLNILRERFGVRAGKWSADERAALAQMSLFVLAIPDLEKFNTHEQAALWSLCRLKGSAHEADYARAMRKATRFFERLRSISA